MSPVFVALALILGGRALGQLGVEGLATWLDAARYGTGATFILMGAVHFTPLRRDVLALVPPSVRRPELVVTVLGLWQVAGGLGLLHPELRPFAAGSLVALLLLKLPANVRIVRQSLRQRGRLATSPGWRIPAQFFWLALVWWVGR